MPHPVLITQRWITNMLSVIQWKNSTSTTSCIHQHGNSTCWFIKTRRWGHRYPCVTTWHKCSFSGGVGQRWLQLWRWVTGGSGSEASTVSNAPDVHHWLQIRPVWISGIKFDRFPSQPTKRAACSVTHQLMLGPPCHNLKHEQLRWRTDHWLRWRNSLKMHIWYGKSTRLQMLSSPSCKDSVWRQFSKSTDFLIQTLAFLCG